MERPMPTDITKILPWTSHDPKIIAAAAVGINVRQTRQQAISTITEEQLPRASTRKKGGGRSISSGPSSPSKQDPKQTRVSGEGVIIDELVASEKRKNKKTKKVPSRARNPLAKVRIIPHIDGKPNVALAAPWLRI